MTDEFVYGLGRRMSLRGGTEPEAEAEAGAGVLSDTLATLSTMVNDDEVEAPKALVESGLATAHLHLHDLHRVVHLVPQMGQADQMTLKIVLLVWQL